MTHPMRWGVLGASNFARTTMARAIHEAQGARFAALATSAMEKATPFVAFCPDLHVYSDYQALLDSPEIDAVYVPLPNHLHVEWAKRALMAGKHVLVEKPIALQANEIDGLIATSRAQGKLCAEAFMVVHHPQWQRARELVAQGALGRLAHVSARFTYDKRGDHDNIRNNAAFGGGSIRDIGVYTFGLTRFVTGTEPAGITYTNCVFEGGVDTMAEVCARFGPQEGGFSFHSLTSMRMTPSQSFCFHGSDGMLTLETPFNADLAGPARLVLTDKTGSRVESFVGARQYALQVEAFVRAAHQGTAFGWSLEDARGTQAMMDAVFAAV